MGVCLNTPAERQDMAKLWLPIEYGGRKRDILIPNADQIDKSQLEEIIEWQKERTTEELKKLPPKQPLDTLKAKEIGQMLREYLAFIRKRKETGHGRIF